MSETLSDRMFMASMIGASGDFDKSTETTGHWIGASAWRSFSTLW